MTEQAGEDVIRHAVVVETSVEEAFQVFTERFGEWWPASYTFSGEDLEFIGIECRTGGRCYERDHGGNELIWGEVLECASPERIVFSWWIAPDRSIVADRLQASEVDVRFKPDGNRTLVELEHRHLARHAGDWRMMQAAMASQEGWPVLLQAYAELTSPQD